MIRRLAASTAVAALGLVVVTPSAQAAAGVNIDHIAAEDTDTVRIVLSTDSLPPGETPDLSSLSVTVDDAEVEATVRPLEEGDVARTVVLALDASLSMRGERFTAAKQAAKAYVAAAPTDVQVGLLTFSGSVHDVTPPTTDHATIDAAIDDIELRRGTLLFDAVLEASRLAGPDGARSVLVLSDGRDAAAGSTLAEATQAASEAGVVVDVVALDQTADVRAELASLAEATGGSVIDTDSVDALEAAFAAQADALSTQLLVEFPQPPTADGESTVRVSLGTGDATYEDSAFVSLAETAGGLEAAPSRSVVIGDTGLLLGAAGLAVGLAGVLFIVLLGARKPSGLQQQMSYYSAVGAADERVERPAAPTMRETAVAATEKIVKGDFETRLSQRLNGAGLSVTAAEWLLIHAGIAVALAFVGLVLDGPALMVVMLVAGVLAPWLFLKVKHSRRLAAFNSQLAETLQLIAGGLSAGLSLPQAVDTVVREGNEPMAGELRRALTEQRLGIEVDEALDGVAQRMESEDFSWVVMAIRIQREVGGNLAELLNTVSDTLRERDYLRRQVKVLSAEGRMSAYVLGGLPVAMFLYMQFVRPESTRVFYTEPLGMVMAAAAVVLLAVGFFALSRIVKVEV